MRVEVVEKTGIRRATARLEEAGVIQVKIPRHWPKWDKQRVVDELVGRIQSKNDRQLKLLERETRKQARVTIATEAELVAYVQRINSETFNAPLGPVKMGYAKYDHLAQVNLKTKTMTVSKYCLINVPELALRYLVVHELAHYYEGGHDGRFWALVAQHVPDHRLQSRIIKAFHHQAVIGVEDDLLNGAPTAPPPCHDGDAENDFELWDSFEPDFNDGFVPQEEEWITPDESPIAEPKPYGSNPAPDAGLIKPETQPQHLGDDLKQKSEPPKRPGFFEQLRLWGL